MVEHILGLSSRPDVIDQLAPDQVANDRLNTQHRQ
jgi:hypothetical protein